MRPQLWVLRDPVVPRQAALAARESILEEVDALDAKEIVLVAQDLASYGNDIDQRRAIIPLVADVAARVDVCGCSTCIRPTSPTV